MDPQGRLGEGAVRGILAFAFVTFLLTVALWPRGGQPSGAAPADGGSGSIDVPAATQGDVLTGEDIVGRAPYTGPTTGQGLVDLCTAAVRGISAGNATRDKLNCYTDALKALLVGRGANASFDALEAVSGLDPAVNGQSHSIAHDLGRYAYVVYGSIQTALANCSLKIFQGCFHGALQSYFEALPTPVTPTILTGLCTVGDQTRRSTCVHGIGHGLMLYTNNNVNASLGLCDGFNDSYFSQSCWSGVVMENLVGYYESIGPNPHQHSHGNFTGPPGYMITRAGDPYFPCDAVPSKYQFICWQQQADYILWANHSDFADTAAKCDAAPAQFTSECRERIGSDSSGWYRDVNRTLADCSYGNATGRAACIRGMAEEIVLNFYSATPAMEACRQVTEADKQPCYMQAGASGKNVESDMDAVCAQAETAYIETCRQAAGLGSAPTPP